MSLFCHSTLIFAQNQTNKTIVSLTVDNDFFFFIDRYYTSGIEISYSNKILRKFPLVKLMLPSNSDFKDYYSVSLIHRIYTPEKTLTPKIVTDDRPYAAYVITGVNKSSYNNSEKVLLRSSFYLGFIGSVAGGEQIQNTLHSFTDIAYKSEGWHHQMKNDLCMMYSASIEKGIISTPYVEINGDITATLGVPHTEASIGSYFRTGFFNDYFRGISIDISEDINAWLFCSGHIKYVHYNATLQGGTYNQDNDFTYYEIEPILLQGNYGIVVQYKSLLIKYSYVVLSPEFRNGWWHRWGHIELSLAF